MNRIAFSCHACGQTMKYRLDVCPNPECGEDLRDGSDNEELNHLTAADAMPDPADHCED